MMVKPKVGEIHYYLLEKNLTLEDKNYSKTLGLSPEEYGNRVEDFNTVLRFYKLQRNILRGSQLRAVGKYGFSQMPQC